MKTTKKPMMAKRATKAAPAKKTMAAKKPMTVAGKTVKKYQVGGPAMGTMPKGMVGTLGSPRAKPTTTVGMQRPTIAPGMTAAQMRQAYGQSMDLNKAEAQRRNAGMATDFGGALGGAQPPRFTNYGPGSGQFQQPGVQGRQPGMPMGGIQSNNGAGMIANNPGALTGGMNQNDMARQQLMQQGMTPQQIQAQEAAIRQEMLRRGMPLGQGVGLPVGPRQGMGAPPASPRMTPQQLQQQMAQSARGLGMGLPGGSQQQMPPMMQGLQGLGARQAPGFRKGGAVAKKKKPAATTRGRMAKPARKR